MQVQALLGRGNTRTTAWIEYKSGLTVGSQVQLLPENEYWGVIELYDTRSDEAVKKDENNYRKHRRGTDI